MNITYKSLLFSCHLYFNSFLDWCGPCKLVAPIFKALADELPQVKFVKVDTEVHEDSVDSFNIQGLPLFGIFVDGKMVRTYV